MEQEFIKNNRRAEIAFQALSELADALEKRDGSDLEATVDSFKAILKRASTELKTTFR